MKYPKILFVFGKKLDWRAQEANGKFVIEFIKFCLNVICPWFD
jgi:hypothetical protein